MKLASLFIASRTVTVPASVLLCILGGTAQAAPPSAGGSTALPDVTVDAPKHTAKPHQLKQRAVARSIVSHPGPTTNPTRSESLSPTEQLARLPNAITGSCVDGCSSSLPSGNKPWVGCNVSGGIYSTTCRNVGHYRTYSECTTAGLAIGWRSNEISWYCSSLALKS